MLTIRVCEDRLTISVPLLTTATEFPPNGDDVTKVHTMKTCAAVDELLELAIGHASYSTIEMPGESALLTALVPPEVLKRASSRPCESTRKGTSGGASRGSAG